MGFPSTVGGSVSRVTCGGGSSLPSQQEPCLEMRPVALFCFWGPLDGIAGDPVALSHFGLRKC